MARDRSAPDTGRTIDPATGDIEISDPRVMRALAHPARLKILDYLQLEGPGTATECAEAAGITPSACSYHLRSLARYGLVQEAPSRGDGRERVWQAGLRGFRFTYGDEAGPDVIAADTALTRTMLEAGAERMAAWLTAQHDEPREWQKAAFLSNHTILVTPEELGEISDRVMELLSPYFSSNRSREQAPEGARLVYGALRWVPRVRRSGTGGRTRGGKRAPNA
jgi:DNA-binding transcriptional ArsR family regulator